MKALLENIDLFPFKINFNYKKNNVFHSFFGLGLSTIMYGVLIYFISYFSRDFINMTNPSIIYKETEFTDNINLKFNDIFKIIYFKLYNFSNYENFLNEKNTTILNHFGLQISICKKYPEYLIYDFLTLNFTSSNDSSSKTELNFYIDENFTFLHSHS